MSHRDRRVIVALLRYHVSLQVSVCTCFLEARLSQDLVCRIPRLASKIEFQLLEPDTDAHLHEESVISVRTPFRRK